MKFFYPRLFTAPVVLAGLMLATPLSGRAQSTTADITGTVTDTTGAILPDATVTLTNLGTKETRTAITTNAGDYTFTLLNPGSYSITVTEDGFKSFQVPQINVAASDRAREDAKLEIGSTDQTVSVTGQAPALQSDSSVLTSTVTQKAVQDLPLNGRNYINLAQITPGANEGPPNGLTSGSRPDDRRQTSSISVNGQSDVINDEMVDGMDNNERIIGTIGIRPSIEAISQINVQSNTYTADVGRTAGGVINIITKSGTNNFHGSLYEFFRNDALDASPYQFGAHNRKPELRQNQFGGSIGGPILHNKLFFFGDYEGLRQVTGLNPVTSQVPTLAQYNAIQSNNLAALQTLTHGAPIDQVGLNYAKLYPMANAPSLSPNTGTYVMSPVDTRSSDTADIRLDYQANQNNLFFGRYTYNRVPSNFPGQLPLVNEDGMNIAPGGAIWNYYGNAKDDAQNAQLNYIHTFTPNVLLQLGFGYTRINNQSFPLNSGLNVNTAFGQPNANIDSSTSGLAPVSTSGLADLGDGDFLPIHDVDNTFQYQGAVTITHGAHNIKIGGSLIRRQALSAQNNYGLGSWTFNPLSGDPTGIGALLSGDYTTLQRSNSITPPHYRMWESSGYVQDDWHVLSNLTLNLGLRYDVFTPYTEAHNAISNFDPTTGTIIVAGQNGTNNYAGLHPTWSNVAPRIGFAYTPHPSWVLRGGFGMSYVPENFTSNASLKNQPFISSVLCNNGACPDGITTLAQGPPLPVAQSITNPSGAIPDTLDPHFRTSYLEQFNLTLEKQLGANVVRASYVGMLGRHLATAIDDQNVPMNAQNQFSNMSLQTMAMAGTNGITTTAQAYNSLRPYYSKLPNVTQIGGYYSTGSSSYNSLQLSFERRTSKGLTMGANYTLAHGLDDTIGISNEINDGFSNIPSEIHTIEYGNSDLDIRNRGVVTANYELPFGKTSRGLEHVLIGGWQANTLLVWESGMPFTVTNSQDVLLTANAGFTDRPDALFNARLAHPTPGQYFNTAAFGYNAQNVANGTTTIDPQMSGILGSARKNSLYGPHYRHVDVSLFKTFTVYKESTLEFRAEAFNVTNTTNYSTPNASLQVTPDTNAQGGYNSNNYFIQGSTFGQITATSPNYNPRQLQFALKYQF
ncbi:MAG TPA: TonB-dependent receptor [Granulicella sp.]|nr:TonB-dependent receptor [Granulicella sp.]